MTSSYDLPAHKRLCEDFNALHGPGPIRLANAWDAGTAKLIAAAGATAIATTSGGASWARGLPDGNSLTRDQALENIASIVASVDLPVTADIETGYATSLDELTTTMSNARKPTKPPGPMASSCPACSTSTHSTAWPSRSTSP